jgi:MSHA biogenesis protein MshP
MFLSTYSKGKASIKNQQGSALAIAVFIIVITSMLAAALIKMLSSTADSVAYGVIGTRAFQAAQTGVQLKLAQIFPLGSGAVTCAVADFNGIPDISSVNGLENCTITVVCNSDIVIDAVTYYTVTSTGSCSVADVTTSRTIEVGAKSL